MKILLDASTLINLINSGVLSKVLALPDKIFFVGSYVEGECFDEEQCVEIKAAMHDNLLLSVEEEIKLNEFASYQKELNLGAGETECIILSEKNSAYIIASDDGSARTKAIHKFGKQRVVGSLYLLRELFRYDLLECDEVKLYYAAMIIKGAFLPPVDESYLCNQLA